MSFAVTNESIEIWDNNHIFLFTLLHHLDQNKIRESFDDQYDDIETLEMDDRAFIAEYVESILLVNKLSYMHEKLKCPLAKKLAKNLHTIAVEVDDEPVICSINRALEIIEICPERFFQESTLTFSRHESNFYKTADISHRFDRWNLDYVMQSDWFTYEHLENILQKTDDRAVEKITHLYLTFPEDDDIANREQYEKKCIDLCGNAINLLLLKITHLDYIDTVHGNVFYNLTRLTTLTLEGSYIDVENMEIICSNCRVLTTLRTIRCIYQPDDREDDFNYLCLVPNLTSIDISECDIDEVDLAYLTRIIEIENLNTLVLRENFYINNRNQKESLLTDEILFDVFKSLKNLTDVDLSSNPNLRGYSSLDDDGRDVTPHSFWISELGETPRLKRLAINNCTSFDWRNIQNKMAFSKLFSWKALQCFSAHGVRDDHDWNNTTQFFHCFYNPEIHFFQDFDVSFSTIKLIQLSTISHMIGLKKLSMRKCGIHFTEEVFAKLSVLSNLIHLDVRDNRIDMIKIAKLIRTTQIFSWHLESINVRYDTNDRTMFDNTRSDLSMIFDGPLLNANVKQIRKGRPKSNPSETDEKKNIEVDIRFDVKHNGGVYRIDSEY